MKKLKVLALGIIFCLSLTANVFASDYISNNYEVQYIDIGDMSKSARYILIKQIGIGLTIENRVAYIYAECTTYENSDITVVAELQMYDNGWDTIKTFKNIEDNSKISNIDTSYAVARGYDYRVKVTASVKQGSLSDSTTKYGKIQECYDLNN